MPKSASGIWLPDLFDLQFDVFNSYARALLVCGPRLSGKTRAVLHRVVRHLWETPGARVAMFSRTLKNSADGGGFALLNDVILKEWIDAKIGLAYTTKTSEGRPGWKVSGQTRTPYFKIRNYHGGESTLMLFSLDHDPDIEDKLKDMEFSMIYFSELSKFRSRKILGIARLSLRMGHLQYQQQQWIADTNPSEEGEASWIYETWYLYKNFTYPEYVEYNKKRGLVVLEERLFRALQDDLYLIEIPLEANPRIDQRQIDEVKTENASDVGLYNRHVLGKWVYGDGDSSVHFKNYFAPNIHVVGNATSADEDEWQVILPTSACTDLITGWDIGDTNHAGVIVEPVLVGGVKHFNVLEESCSIGAPVSVIEFTESLMDLIDALEQYIGHQANLERAWSDRSSLEKYQATGDTFAHLQVFNASGGRIELIGVPKPKNSVRARVQVLKMLLKQRRIHVSAHLYYVIKMLKELKKGTTPLTYVVPDENKHVFDALTYALFWECAEELESHATPRTGQIQTRPGPLIVQV